VLLLYSCVAFNQLFFLELLWVGLGLPERTFADNWIFSSANPIDGAGSILVLGCLTVCMYMHTLVEAFFDWLATDFHF